MAEDHRVALLREEVADAPRFMRRKLRDGSFEPVSVWTEGEKVWAQEGSRPAVEADALWIETALVWCKPIEESTYWAVMDGARWPDMPDETPATFSNLPADPFAALVAEIESERENVLAWLKDPQAIRDQETKDKAANWIDRVAKLEKRGDAMRVEEKRPHDEAAREVQQKFKPVLAKAAETVDALKRALAPYLKAERERAKAEGGGEGARFASTAGKAGSTGRVVALHSRKRAKIMDHDKALHALRHHSLIVEALQKAADAIVRGGGTVPGVEIITEEGVQ